MRSVGNARGREIYQGNAERPANLSSNYVLEQWIRDKYDRKIHMQRANTAPGAAAPAAPKRSPASTPAATPVSTPAPTPKSAPARQPEGDDWFDVRGGQHEFTGFVSSAPVAPKAAPAPKVAPAPAKGFFDDGSFLFSFLLDC